MKKSLFIAKIRPGKMKAYHDFGRVITGERKKEYKALLARYGFKVTRVWTQHIGNEGYALIYHEVTEGAEERLKEWDSSTHPFDMWFRDQLEQIYENGWEEAHFLFECEI